MEKYCPKCNAEISESAKFCTKCGCNLKEYQNENAFSFCPECGAKCQSNDLFCPECGTKIKETNTFNGSVNTDQSFGGGFDAWGTSNDGLDGWGETLKKFSQAEESERLKIFEYKKTPTGNIVIQKLLDEYALLVEIPDGVAVIGEGTFENCGILSVTIPEGVTTIGKRAFANCKNLESINFPQSLVRIDDEAFISCEKLEIKIPNTVKILGNNAINGTKTEILKQRAEAEAKRKAEEEARRRAEEEARRKAEAEAKRKAEEEEAKKKTEETNRKNARDIIKRHMDTGYRAPDAHEAVQYLRYFQEFAEQGSADAMATLGAVYDRIISLQDQNKSYYWYKKGAEKNHPICIYGVALCLFDGKGCTRNIEEGMKMLHRSADLDYKYAYMMLVQEYTGGFGKTNGAVKDLEKAKEWKKKYHMRFDPIGVNYYKI